MKIIHLIICGLLLWILQSCKDKVYSPDWTVDLTSEGLGKNIISIKGDTLLFTELVDYSKSIDINDLLQSDSVIIKPLKEWDYIEHHDNVLVFDSLTPMLSSHKGNRLGELLNYVPQRDLSHYPETDCWSSCNGLKLATFGCTCEFELSSNYKGYKIILSYFTRHFKCETSTRKIKILILKNKKIIDVLTISNYNNILESQLVYFKTDDAVYFRHYNSVKKEIILAKYSFDRLIDNIDKK